jgi:hypothetical protein
MPKYKKHVEEMLLVNKKQFDAFKIIHDKYAEDPKTWQAQFNEEGRDIMIIIQRW